MRRLGLPSKSAFLIVTALFVSVVAVRAVGTVPSVKTQKPAAAPVKAAQDDSVLRGRQLVINHACGHCHGGIDDPGSPNWLAGLNQPPIEFEIGPPPCGIVPRTKGCFKTRPRNLTPDNDTGLGRFTERQIFNSLRYGLRPENTPDVTITSTTPGQGNFPKIPHYLAPPMPWPDWRHMPDSDLRAIAAYLKRGLKPVVNKVPDSEGPPDFWASGMTPDKIGVYPTPAFPTANERTPAAKDLARVMRGRQLVLDHGCGGCHRGLSPNNDGWLGGITDPNQELVFGPCFADEKVPCVHGRPKNLTPDKETGLGRWTDRQVFNALRYGLKPEDTPDAKIISMKPGDGNFPKEPHYLGPFMPWSAWRYLSDEDLWSIVTYLRHIKPVSNKVALSDDTPDHWAGEVAKFAPYPARPFPTPNEVGRR